MTKKIAYTSDLHLEFGDIHLENKDDIDILILAGDISTPHRWNMNHNSSSRKDGARQKAFFKRISQEFPYTLYIPGNHEHYHGYYEKTVPTLQEALQEYKNIVVNDHIVSDHTDFTIIANTLWTDFNGGNPIVMMQAANGMNDFQIVRSGKIGTYKFSPQQALEIHRNAVAQIVQDIEYSQKPIVMISHHLPSYQAISEGFRDSRLNGAYASDLDWMMEKYPITHWIHGHSHPPLDMVVHNTRLLRKPRGYLHHENTPDQDSKYTYGIIEV